MAELVLGELEVAYTEASADGAPTVTITSTGDVAEILERRYGVMQTFFDRRRDKIAGYLADSMANALQDRINGRRGGSPTFEAEQKIEAEFRSFLDANEMDILSVGLAGPEITNPHISAAAAAGSNSRKKSTKSNARPAFVDTGLYRANFRVTVNLPHDKE